MAPMLSPAQKTGKVHPRRQQRLLAFVSGVILALLLHFGVDAFNPAANSTATSHATPQTFVVADGGGTGMPPCNC